MKYNEYIQSSWVKRQIKRHGSDLCDGLISSLLYIAQSAKFTPIQFERNKLLQKFLAVLETTFIIDRIQEKKPQF